MKRRVVISFAFGVGLLGCGVDRQSSRLEYDSAVNVALDGEIAQGSVITDTDAPAGMRYEVVEQLRYAIGQLNGEGGGLDLIHADITLGTPTRLGSNTYRVPYAAKVLVSWPREQRVPARYQLLLPAHGDGAGRQAFFNAFNIQTNLRTCLADDAHDIGVSSFWYYYRPYGRRCPVQTAGSDQVARTVMSLTPSGQNSTGKAPEYDKVWEDGKLVVTGVFSKFEAGGTTTADVGIAGFTSAYNSLVTRFGAPVTTSLPAGQGPSAVNNDIRLTFASPKGPVDAALFLVDTVTSAGADFRAKFEERTLTSDAVIYDGHSGLGANIAALTRMGKFAPGQYQIYLLNGCDTFAYTDDTLKLAHQAVNPDAGADKYLDVITNARPAEFNYMTTAAMSLINALATPGPTYRQILAKFDGSQRASVGGEQDNNWPAPF